MATPKQQRINPASVPAPRPKAGKSGRPGGRPPGVAKVKKATTRDWIGGARLQTLPLAIAPVALGTAAAYVLPHGDAGPGWHWLRAALCLIVALSLQIGVNFANDYSDGIRGTDKHRVGPRRLTGSGAAKPRTVLTVALVFFAIAALAGLVIVIRTEYWWLLAVGAVAIVAAYFYTGGKRPYGYAGLGELFVFIFFGLVATAGTTFALAGTVTLESWLSAIAIGLIATAVLMVNNIRDIQQDKLAGKRTLAVRIGDLPSRIVFGVMLLAPFGILSFFTLFYENAYLVYFALLAAIPAVGITISAKTPGELIIALRLSAIVALVYGLGLGWAIAF
ncbi:1,4-dihydroxy-2-naphthoate polyprenyltransferase [Salinibacterium sp. G-O1]|uniref:1,4-dihydroxy-2-naphthoate polyprenyltransferase n=1 Tax=Salinibacterium sp. G-O1 TaxID=3046208 RepID=UPI0024B8EF0D|nr:1,4-dihydroxy-2-naphthoate polyprenyltransferase [Salinibacterium sp. G-O1]MDJ0336368.1 1,4-dihydroxy-2-naphthoate polyprenyltransferase [Salinibacterium sp. G-O1]